MRPTGDMWLVLCDPRDLSAIWAGQGLRDRGASPVEFLSPLELICSLRLEYRAGGEQPPVASATLSSGKTTDVRRLLGTINRAHRCEFPQVRGAAAGDRDYVRGELEAIMLAWLGALPAPVFNPAHASGWAGEMAHSFVWALRAQKAGFRTETIRCGHSGLDRSSQISNSSMHVVFGGHTYPQLPQELELAAVRLAEIAAIPLLGVAIEWLPNGLPHFVGATPEPDLRVGGAPFLDALAAALGVR